ncbi:hypothetical protein BU17DRAFT_96359 [Hysterangium stoloniferum]|nr:hypothetical protein BU17DRAFT_96359 [Hysterangium stoloniferum]
MNLVDFEGFQGPLEQRRVPREVLHPIHQDHARGLIVMRQYLVDRRELSLVCVNHIPRPEDWPVMPVGQVRLTLKPVDFFDANPD